MRLVRAGFSGRRREQGRAGQGRAGQSNKARQCVRGALQQLLLFVIWAQGKQATWDVWLARGYGVSRTQRQAGANVITRLSDKCQSQSQSQSSANANPRRPPPHQEPTAFVVVADGCGGRQQSPLCVRRRQSSVVFFLLPSAWPSQTPHGLCHLYLACAADCVFQSSVYAILVAHNADSLACLPATRRNKFQEQLFCACSWRAAQRSLSRDQL
jgi:hypothetical protein